MMFQVAQGKTKKGKVSQDPGEAIPFLSLLLLRD